jgi:hypothetical protein
LGLEDKLASAQANITAFKISTDQLQSQLADLRAVNDELRGAQTLYDLWRTTVLVSLGIAAALALALLLTWGRARDAERHNVILLNEAQVMHTAF